MAETTRNERRYLSDEEREFVAQTHHPALRELGDEELAALVPLLRARHDRARDIAQRQRRELRGKAPPAGARPATDDTGSRRKRSILAAALKRANKERQRRRARAALPAQVAYARKALAMKRSSEDASHRPDPGQTPGDGMRSIPDESGPDLVRPMEVGRVSEFVRAAQAKKDSR
jgi:hypothetical protein